MLRLAGLAFGAGFGVAAWKNLPKLSHPMTGAAVVLVVLAVVAAYVGGRLGTRQAAVAVATARAEALALAAVQANPTATAQQSTMIVIGDPGRGARAAGAGLGLDRAPWLAGARHRAELDDEGDAVETMLADVREVEET